MYYKRKYKNVEIECKNHKSLFIMEKRINLLLKPTPWPLNFGQ